MSYVIRSCAECLNATSQSNQWESIYTMYTKPFRKNKVP